MGGPPLLCLTQEQFDGCITLLEINGYIVAPLVFENEAPEDWPNDQFYLVQRHGKELVLHLGFHQSRGQHFLVLESRNAPLEEAQITEIFELVGSIGSDHTGGSQSHS